MNKHLIKHLLAQVWARVLFHTGAWRVVNRLAPRRLLILAGHCVDDPAVNAELPSHLRIKPARLKALLGGLGKHFPVSGVASGLATLRGSTGSRGVVALSMDDGYRDNLTALPQVLAATGAGCTVYLESRVLTEGRANWGHQFFWLMGQGTDSPEAFAAAWVQSERQSEATLRLKELLNRGQANEYQVKKVLKYHVQPEQRDAFVNQRFRDRGGSEADLCQRIHLDAEGVRAMLDVDLAEGELDIGGHTRTHEVLASLSIDEQEREIGGAKEDLENLFPGRAGTTFAYPYGRDWDWNRESQAAVRAAGYTAALTTMPGVVTADSDPFALPRIMIEDSTELHMLVAHACGGFLIFKSRGRGV